MGGNGEKGEKLDWSQQNTKVFIEKIYDRVKKGQLQGSTFKTSIWEEINNELKSLIGENYGVERLKGKFNRLRLQHRQFSTLLSRTGVTWNSEANKVNAPDELWEELYKQGRFYKNFRRHGFEYDYDILGEIFNTSTATGKLHQASTQDPPTSDDERELERAFLSNGVHIDIDDVGDGMQEPDNKRKSECSSSERLRKEPKSSKLDAALSKWVETCEARKEASNAKAERYKALANEATSPTTDPYSVGECVDLLESMEDVSDKAFNTALKKFTKKEWREMFVKMSLFRRTRWLASFE